MAGNVAEIISSLYDMVQDAWSLPLSSDKCVLERDKVLDLLDEINNQLPAEFKQAQTIVDARNEIIANAKKEAEALQKQAEMKASQIISDQEIVVAAKKEAEIILQDAREQAEGISKATESKLQDLKNASIQFVVDALAETENAIAEALHDVSAKKAQLDSMIILPGSTAEKRVISAEAEEYD